MSVYAISDLHLALDNPEKTMEVFEGWENYIEKIKINWEENIKPEDTVVIVGDISWAMKLEEAIKDLTFVDKLPGKKILVKGNHDLWWSTATKINRFLKEKELNSISILYNNAIQVEDICICGTRGWMFKAQTEQDKKIINREVQRLRRSIEEAE